ncbi:MAG TPA: PTS sugar transporter subunit IIA [Elusimicrobiales bacterium]|nr:PTS sugar transporter subunit IIA [Elusimicrobiales bacterium]
MSPQSESSIKISDFLKTKRIVIVRSDTTKQKLIEKLTSLIAKDLSGLKKDFLLDKIVQRERGISTTLDTGLSIPHARIENINDFAVALALIPKGLKEGSSPSADITAMFLFLSPSDAKFFQKHLKLLSVLSSTFQPEFINKLNSLKTPKQVLDAIANHTP